MESTPWDPEGVTVVLDPTGRLADPRSVDGLDLRDYYQHLVAARCLDLKLGRMGLPRFASAAGEEAALVAAALHARRDDWIYPGPRDAAVCLTRGMPDEQLAATLLGQNDDAGSSPAGHVAWVEHGIAAATESLGLHLAWAAGHAHGQKLTGSGAITLGLFGEGLTTTGAFHEATMLAVAADLPLVLVCRSQLWPDGAPAEAGLVGDAVAERARGSGLWVRRVDGADPIGVYAAIGMAASRAREGRGPGLVEAVVTRLHGRNPPGHRDPLERLRRHLDQTGAWTQAFQDEVETQAHDRLDRAFHSASPSGDAV